MMCHVCSVLTCAMTSRSQSLASACRQNVSQIRISAWLSNSLSSLSKTLTASSQRKTIFLFCVFRTNQNCSAFVEWISKGVRVLFIPNAISFLSSIIRNSRHHWSSFFVVSLLFHRYQLSSKNYHRASVKEVW